MVREIKGGVGRKLEELFYDVLQVHTLLKPTDVERLYGVKVDTVRKWYYRGHLPGLRIVEGLKFRRIDVERIIGQRMPHLLEQFREVRSV